MKYKSQNGSVGVFITALFLWGANASFAHAYVPVFTTQESLHDIETINDPAIAQVFFGELIGMPHTYEMIVDKVSTLSLELRTPQSASSTNTISGIVIKVPRKGRVEEVTRLEGKNASWEMARDEITYDTYLQGSSYEGTLEPGTYRIEVHTPNNSEKYMLRIGTNEEMTIGYIELLKRLSAVKEFYGTSRVWLVLTPYVYIPLLLFVSIVGVLWHLRRRPHTPV